MANTDLSGFLTKTGAVNKPALVDPANNNNVITENNYTVNTNTRVNIGTSPNSNDGDPLRTAFQKLNNFIEAVYRTNTNINTDITSLSATGSFLGAKTYTEITALSPTVNDTLMLANQITTINPDATPVYSNYILTSSFVLANGTYTIAGGSLLKYNGTKWAVEHDNSGKNITFDFDGALARLAGGTATSQNTATAQQEMYASYLKLNQGAANSVRLQANTVEDAIVELTVKSSTSGRDAGYYA
jgi:hypothetical protein